MATRWLADWQSESQKQRLKPNARSAKPTNRSRKPSVTSTSASTIVAAAVVLGSMFGAGQVASAESVKLNGQQQETLLAEANDAYKTALEKAGSDAAEAKQGFADAAGKYQLLVDGGVAGCISISAMRISKAAMLGRRLRTICARCGLIRRCAQPRPIWRGLNRSWGRRAR